MKKIFTLFAAVAMAAGLHAQTISWDADSKLASTFESGNLVLTLVDENDKMAIDANNAYFGTETANTKYTHRLKSGGKSSSKNMMTLTIPAAGTLKVAARTGNNSATDRNLVLTQDGTEIFNEIMLESNALKVKGLDAEDPEKETNVYPYVSVAVTAGDVVVTYPTNSINFYAFILEAGDAHIGNVTVDATDTVLYNLAGQKVDAAFKGIAVMKGKKVVMK